MAEEPEAVDCGSLLPLLGGQPAVPGGGFFGRGCGLDWRLGPAGGWGRYSGSRLPQSTGTAGCPGGGLWKWLWAWLEAGARSRLRAVQRQQAAAVHGDSRLSRGGSLEVVVGLAGGWGSQQAASGTAAAG